MEIGTLIGAVLYFTIGWILSDWLNTEAKSELTMFIFLFWPLMVAMLALMLVLAVAMLIAVLLSKLVGLVHFKGGNSNGSV